MSGGIRIDENFRLRIVYQDESPFGSAVSGECDETIRSLCPDIVSAWKQSGLRDVILCGRQMLEAAFQRGAFAPLYLNDTTIRPDVLYPSPVSIRPAALEVSCRTTGLSEVCALPPALMAELSLWLGDWLCGAFTPRQSPAAELWKQLNDLGALTDQPRPAPSRHAATPGVTFVGHATVKVTSEKGSILIDPFLLPPSLLYPPTYQPLSIDELGRPDAVFITHSHPDHFDLGSLLSLGPDMPVYVPVVGRESLLAIDMVYRLEELGFRNVREMKWFDHIRVGDLRVTALPFYGEQPSSDEVLHPEVRNEGNTYLVEDGADRYAFIADAGRDRNGSPLRVAQEA